MKKNLPLVIFILVSFVAIRVNAQRPRVTLKNPIKIDGTLMKSIYLEETNVDSKIRNIDEAVESLGGDPFRIEDRVLYDIIPIPLLGITEEERARRQLENVRNRNAFMRGLGYFEESAGAQAAQNAQRELSELEVKFNTFSERNRLDLNTLNTQTLPGLRVARDGLQRDIGKINREIRALQNKIAKGEIDEDCSFFEVNCEDNRTRLADKKEKLEFYQNELENLDGQFDRVEENITSALALQEQRVEDTDDFAEKVLKIVKDSEQYTLKEEAALLTTAIGEHAAVIRGGVTELQSLRSGLSSLRARMTSIENKVDMAHLKAELQEEMGKIKDQFLADACEQTPSCSSSSRRRPSEAIDNGPRENLDSTLEGLYFLDPWLTTPPNPGAGTGR